MADSAKVSSLCLLTSLKMNYGFFETPGTASRKSKVKSQKSRIVINQGFWLFEMVALFTRPLY
jgi:hypothetical protein